MTTLYDDYIWDGGNGTFGSIENWRQWQKRSAQVSSKGYPLSHANVDPIKKDDKKADDLFPTKTEVDNKIEELEKKLVGHITNSEHEANVVYSEIYERLSAAERKIKILEIDVQLLEDDNEKLKKLLNTYDRFDMMDFDK